MVKAITIVAAVCAALYANYALSFLITYGALSP